MSRQEESAVQFLIGLGVLTSEDAKTVQKAQVDPIVRTMIEKESLGAAQAEEAKKLVAELLASANHTRRLRAQMSLMKLVAGKMRSRINVSSSKIRRNKERITTGRYPVVAPILAKSSGD